MAPAPAAKRHRRRPSSASNALKSPLDSPAKTSPPAVASAPEIIGSEERVTNDPMEAHYIGFNMWVEAVEKAGTTDPEAVQEAIIGVEVPNLTGGTAVMLANHHITKPVLIGEIQDDGQFAVVWETDGLVKGDAWSDFLPGSKDLISDWTAPIKCGNYNTKTKSCGGAAAK